MKEIRIYYEGTKLLREGFHHFLQEIREAGRPKRIKVTAVPTSHQLARSLAKADRSTPESLNVLLLDSEIPLDASTARTRGVGNIPTERLFWMVQSMESWYLAHPEALSGYYGQGFRDSAFRNWTDIETVSRADVDACLAAATRDTRYGRYDKVKHAPSLLVLLDPRQVRGKSRQCRRLFDELLKMLNYGR